MSAWIERRRRARRSRLIRKLAGIRVMVTHITYDPLRVTFEAASPDLFRIMEPVAITMPEADGTAWAFTDGAGHD